MTIEKIAGEAKTTTGAAYSRRNFLKGVTAAGALAAFGLAGCAPKTTSEMAATGTAASNAADVNWDEETEVLVVGSGYAGLAATVAEGCSDYDPATASRARLVRREPAKYPGMHRSSPSAAPSCSRHVGSPIIAALGTTRCPPQPPQAPCSTRSRPPSPPAQHSPSPAFCSPAYATAGWRRGCSSRPPAWRGSPT